MVVPCLNEEASIPSLLTSIFAHLDTVIVVDDGSRDATFTLAQKAGAIVLRNDQPQGKGAALKKGLQHARQLGFTVALTMDGDGQHSPEDIPVFLARSEDSDAALIVGNRMHDGSAMPWVRRVANQWMSRRLSHLAGRDFPDSQCGFRLIRLAQWSAIECRTSHFEYESELLCRFAAAGHQIDSVPIRVIYRNEISKIRPVRDTARWFLWLASYLRHN